MIRSAVLVTCLACLMASPAWASKKLIQAKACGECHEVQREKVGPSWREIAKLYKGTDAQAVLAAKIQRGSAEHWGQNVMTPPAARGVQISETEAKSMARYILRYR